MRILRWKHQACGLALIAAVAGGCTTNDQSASFYSSPGTYTLYSCPQISDAIASAADRERQLQALMDRAGQDAGGRVVNAVAYRPEYLTVQGRLAELRAVGTRKKCDLTVKPVNERGAPAVR